MKDTMKVVMNFKYARIHSIRFDCINPQDNPVCKAIYIHKDSYKELGEPKQITITVQV